MMQSENATAGTVGSVNSSLASVDSSLAYAVQIRCVNNSECNQCEWSPVYSVPPGGSTFPRISSMSEAVPVDNRQLSVPSQN